jgi:hypothetical protein
MIGARDLQVAQEIGVDLMGRMPAAEMRLPIQGLNTHAAHQGRHMPPPNGLALLPQEIAQHAGAGKRMGQMQLVDPPHQRERRL